MSRERKKEKKRNSTGVEGVKKLLNRLELENTEKCLEIVLASANENRI